MSQRSHEQSAGRVPPYSEEAEKGILGSILLDPGNIPDLCIERKLHPDGFYFPAHKIIFTAMGTMIGKDVPIDVITLSEELKKTRKLDAIGGAVTLERLIDETPTSAHAEHYLEEVKKKWLARQLINKAREIEAAVFQSEDPDDIRTKFECDLASMMQTQKPLDVGEIMDNIWQNILDAKNEKGSKVFLPTNYRQLDEENEGGMREGGTYWISGMESTGKSSFAGNLLLRQMELGVPVADLSLEMTAEQRVERLTSILTRQNILAAYRSGPGMDNIQEPFKDARKFLKDSGLYHLGSAIEIEKISEFRSWARRMVNKFKVKVICLDYLQLLEVDNPKGKNEQERVAEVSGAVRRISMALGLRTLCIAERNEAGKVRGSRRADYAGAGHWQLEKPEKHQDGDEVDVTLLQRKARFGKDGTRINMKFQKITGVFYDPEADKERITGQRDFISDHPGMFGGDQHP